MHSLIEIIFPRRLHRLAYFLRGVALSFVTGFLYSNCTTFEPWLFWPVLNALLIYNLFFIALPRIRDIGMSGWWLLLVFFPIAYIVLGIILLFRPPHLLARPRPAPEL